MNPFRDWPKTIGVPVVVNVTTALALFLAALMFKPVRHWLFPPETIAAYPLLCTAEPFAEPGSDVLRVEFFIINRTRDEYSREDLVRFLATHNPDPGATLSPDIALTYWRLVDGRPVGRIGQPYLDKGFNYGKGEVSAVVNEKKNLVNISVGHINPRAIIKISIPIFDLPGLADMDIRRTNKAMIPLEFHAYEQGCYGR